MILYRAINDFDAECVRVRLVEYQVHKETPEGYWIDDDRRNWFGPRRWISKTARRRFAHETKEAAIRSFIARKKRQIKILNFQLETAMTALDLAERGEAVALGPNFFNLP